jgi:DHA1 family multidrug resistance protein-like MFS transporter
MIKVILLSQWKQNLAAMWLAQLAGMGAITGVISFLPLYIPHLGITDPGTIGIWAGLLISISSLGAAASGPYWGNMADRAGRKLMVERVMAVFFLVILAMAFVTNIYQLFALRLTQGLFGGFTAAALALVTSNTPEQELTFAIGIFQTAMIVGSTAGPIFGGIVADIVGYRETFIAFGLLCFVSLLVVHFSVTEQFQPKPAKERTSLAQEMKFVLTLRGLPSMLVVQFLIQFALQAIAPLLPLYVLSLAPDTPYLASTCGMIIAAAGVTSAVASALSGKLSNRYSHQTILFVSAVLAALTFAAQAVTTSVSALALLRGVSGLFLGTMLPCVNAVITLLTPADKRGTVYGVTMSAPLLGNVLGPLTGSLIALHFTITSVFWLTAALFALVAVWVAFHVRDPRSMASEGTPPYSGG